MKKDSLKTWIKSGSPWVWMNAGAVSIAVIMTLGLLAVIELARGADTAHSLTDGLIVAALSFVAALASIAVLMRVVDRLGFLPFVIYRLGLAALLFWWAL